MRLPASAFPGLFWKFLAMVAILSVTACSGGLPDTGNQTPTRAIPTDTLQPAFTAEAATPLATGPAQAEPTQPGPQPSPVQAETALPAREEVSPSPDCASPAAETPAMTEGPYYKPDSPERTSLLEEATPGTRLILSGYVLTTDCKPVAGAWLDFWQTDGNGEYDNAGYKLRGHQFTDEAGRYSLETVVPGLYPGRTAHIHVKVQAPGGPVLTTQLFVPDEPGNTGDRIFSPELVMDMQDGEGVKLGTFNFILDMR
jgi:protocatechuate 3,4-dioxygenase beta subunit